MVSIAAIASFGSVVWWAHNQDVRAGGKGLEPLVVQAPTTPTRIKPENAGGLVPPNQDKEVYNRISPGAVPVQPEKLLPGPTTPKLPAGRHAAAGRAQADRARGQPRPRRRCSRRNGDSAGHDAGRHRAATPRRRANAPTVTPGAQPTTPPAETGPSIASLIDDMSGPTGGWRVQVASVKSEDVAKSTWARAAEPRTATCWPTCACSRPGSISATRACGIASRPARSTRSRRTAFAAR